MTFAGVPFLLSMLYLTLLVSFVISLLELNFCRELTMKTFTRWGKFLLLLVALGVFIQILTVIHDLLV